MKEPFLVRAARQPSAASLKLPLPSIFPRPELDGAANGKLQAVRALFAHRAAGRQRLADHTASAAGAPRLKSTAA
jgi:hypothetical protein